MEEKAGVEMPDANMGKKAGNMKKRKARNDVRESIKKRQWLVD